MSSSGRKKDSPNPYSDHRIVDPNAYEHTTDQDDDGSDLALSSAYDPLVPEGQSGKFDYRIVLTCYLQ